MTPGGDDVRPTADRVREAWMSIVSPLIPEARVLDLFAGSGALGIEAVSRGAREADLVENASPSLRAIADNIEALEATDRIHAHKADAFTFIGSLGERAYDLAFCDPPYDKGLAARVAERWRLIPFADVLGVEHRAWERMPDGGETRRYGRTAITFYRS